MFDEVTQPCTRRTQASTRVKSRMRVSVICQEIPHDDKKGAVEQTRILQQKY